MNEFTKPAKRGIWFTEVPPFQKKNYLDSVWKNYFENKHQTGKKRSRAIILYHKVKLNEKAELWYDDYIKGTGGKYLAFQMIHRVKVGKNTPENGCLRREALEFSDMQGELVLFRETSLPYSMIQNNGKCAPNYMPKNS